MFPQRELKNSRGGQSNEAEFLCKKSFLQPRNLDNFSDNVICRTGSATVLPHRKLKNSRGDGRRSWSATVLRQRKLKYSREGMVDEAEFLFIRRSRRSPHAARRSHIHLIAHPPPPAACSEAQWPHHITTASCHPLHHQHGPYQRNGSTEY